MGSVAVFLAGLALSGASASAATSESYPIHWSPGHRPSHFVT